MMMNLLLQSLTLVISFTGCHRKKALIKNFNSDILITLIQSFKIFFNPVGLLVLFGILFIRFGHRQDKSTEVFWICICFAGLQTPCKLCH